jgi:hypothetical protein
MLTTMEAGQHWEAWQQVIGRDDVDPLEVLSAAAMYERYFQEVQRHAVRVARSDGRSWQEIADTVGATKQSTWQKWRSQKERARELSARFAKFPSGDLTVERMERAYEPLIQEVVDSWCDPEDPIRPDLVNAARAALDSAIDSYDSSGKSVPFAVYAAWWVRQGVIRRRNELRAR